MGLGRRVIGIVMAVALTAAIFGGPARADDGADQQAFVARINELRVAHGVKPVVVDERLVALARAWAVRLATAAKLSHNPNLTTQAPAGWTVLGENVGVSGADVQSLHDAFVASPQHLANLLDARFTSVGVGVVMSGSIMWVAEELMGAGPAPARAAAAAPKAAAPKAKPAVKAVHAPAAHPVRVPATVPVRHRVLARFG